METHPSFHHEFLLEERRAILQRWVADQMEGVAAGPWVTCNPVPLLGYSSEFFDRFLDDLGDHGGERVREWLHVVISESVLDEITPSSLAFFLITLRRAISSLWSMEAHCPRNYGEEAGSHESLVTDANALIDALAALDALLLEGLTMLERHRAADPGQEIDSLEFLRDVATRPEFDSIDVLDSVEVVPPGPCRGGLRNMAGHLRSFLLRDGGTAGNDGDKPTGACPTDTIAPLRSEGGSSTDEDQGRDCQEQYP